MRIFIALTILLFVVWAVVFVLLHTVFHLYRVPTTSMEPTIHSGDSVITGPVHDLKRGDIVAFKYPMEPKTSMLKRIVAVPGDTIEIKNKHVIVNGRELVEPYAIHEDDDVYPVDTRLPEPYRSRDQFGPLTIPARQYFVLGDNRDRSADSRYWGTIPRDFITGEAEYDIGRAGFRKLRQ